MREELDYVFTDRFTKDEFNVLLDILPYKRLTYLFKKFPKKFRDDIHGFRPNHIPKNILDSIFNKYIYEEKQYEMTIHIKIVIEDFLSNIEKRISKVFNNTENLRDEIREDYEKLKKLIDVVYETEISGEIFLYFKMVDYVLDENQITIVDQRISYNKIRQDVLEDLQEDFDDRLKNALEKSRKNIKELEEKKSEIEEFNKELEKKLKKSNINNEKLSKKNKELQVKVESKNNEISNKLDIIETKNIEILELKDLLSNEYNKFSKYASEKYEMENKELFNRNAELLESIKNKDIELKEKVEIIERKNDIIKQIKLKEQTLKQNIINDLEKLTEYTGFNNKIDEEKLVICESRVLNNNGDDEIVKDLDYFIDDLISNLEISGIKRDNSSDIAKNIVATFIKKMGLVLVAGNNLEIANAISELISCRSADVVNIPPNFTNLKNIIDKIKKLKSDVIFIDTPILQMHDEIISILIKKFSREKFLIFSCENIEMIDILNKRLLKYLNFVYLNNATTFKRDEELIHSKLDKRILKIDIDTDIKKRLLRELKRDSKFSNINEVTRLNWCEIAALIERLNGEGIKSIIYNNEFLISD
jgi:hypothetical protein